MNMYCTENMDIPEDFRVELSQFMFGMRRNVAKDIHNTGKNCELGKPFLSFPIYRLMCEKIFWGGQQSCLVEGCLGRAATRTEMWVHFLYRHLLDNVVIMEEGNLPYPRCT